MNGSAVEIVCGECGRTQHFSAPISVILLFAPGLLRPYALIPAVDHRVCGACRAIFAAVSHAAELHEMTKAAHVGTWTRAIVVFQDGHGVDVTPRRMRTAIA